MKKRSIAFLLSLVMLLSLLTPTALAEEPDQEAQVTEESTEIPALSAATVAVPREAAFGDETTVTAPEGAESYQWQFQLMEGLWVNISGDESAAIVLTYAKVCNMLDESGAASLRCLVDGAASETLTVTVTDEPAQEPDETPVPDEEPVLEEEPVLDEEPVAQPVLPVLDPQQSAEDTIVGVSNGAVGVQEETGDEDVVAQDETPNPKKYSVEIKYVFEDGTPAANSWTSTIGENEALNETVTSPTVVGYAPDRTEVVLNVEQVTKDIVETVTYFPAEVNFTVEHYWQNLENDGYGTAPHETSTESGMTNDPVGEGFAKSYDGFTALLYNTRTKIAADGTTVVKIYYVRNYYLLAFNLDGGYGVDPIYARYGATVSVNDPQKAGYTFDGWQPDIPATVPYANTAYTAKWNEGKATYLVQYWQENANDDGYSYESSEQKSGQVGSKVSGKDTKSYTGFHFDHADQNVTIQGNGTSVVNVYYKRNTYTLTFKILDCSKWFLHSHSDDCYRVNKTFTGIKNGADTSYWWNQAASGYVWYTGPSSSTAYSFPATMPNGNLTVYGQKMDGKSTIYYYETGTQNEIKDHFTLAGTYSGLTKEDFVDIPGFTYASNSKRGDTYYIYYNRNSYKLDFNNRGTIIKTEIVPYDKALSSYEIKNPAYPAGLEEGAYEFDGWYTDPGFITPVNWSTDKMPYHNQVLYAKWKLVTHTVRLFQTEDAAEPLYTYTDVTHGTCVAAVEDPKNGSYSFAGWWYKDEDGVEKRFDFSMPIRRDMDIYAKWSDNTMVPFTIHFMLDDETTRVADDYTDYALAGTTLTVDALTGSSLYPDYQKGYFPHVKSHNVKMMVDGTNEFTFIYTRKDTVKYTVRYVDAATGKDLIESVTKDTSDAIVTENFVAIEGYRPDAYQKRLILSSNEEENVIIFYYTVDKVHAPLRVIHWTQNIACTGYNIQQEYTNLDAVIGESYREAPKNLTGFHYARGDVNGVETALVTIDGVEYLQGIVESGTGLVLNLYYDRNSYDYVFRFLKEGTDEVLEDPVEGSALYESQVTERAKTIPGYVLVGPAQSQTIKIGTSGNERTFYYKEADVTILYKAVTEDMGSVSLGNESIQAIQGDADGSTPTAKDGYEFKGWYKDEQCVTPVDGSWVGADNKLTPQKENGVYVARTYYAKFAEKEITINYVAVGPDGATGFGSVTPTSETVKVVTGAAQGSTAAANDGFRFVGWYDNANCTGTALSTELKYVPTKPGDLWTDATYYAKFEPDVADLTITKTGCANIDENQSFIFTVTGEGLPTEGLKVVVTGNGSVTIKGLKVGTTYTITEDTGWSWRYTPEANGQEHTMVADKTQNTVTFTNERKEDKWLNGCSIKVNNWKKKAGEESPETN